MISESGIRDICEYAVDSQYCCAPTGNVVHKDTAVAGHWNCLWNSDNHALIGAQLGIGNVIDEINNVLNAVSMQPVPECTNQLATAIDLISRTLGNADYAGAVKSSDTWGQVSIAPDGVMTVNCLGNASCLNTTCKEVVGAINELNNTYCTCYSCLSNDVSVLASCQVNCIETVSGTYCCPDANGVISLGLGSAAYCECTYFLPHECLGGILVLGGTDMTAVACTAGNATLVATATNATTAACRYSGCYYARCASTATCYNGNVTNATSATTACFGCVQCVHVFACSSGCFTIVGGYGCLGCQIYEANTCTTVKSASCGLFVIKDGVSMTAGAHLYLTPNTDVTFYCYNLCCKQLIYFIPLVHNNTQSY